MYQVELTISMAEVSLLKPEFGGLHKKAQDWLKKETTGEYEITGSHVWFTEEKDAVYFRLTWE